MYIYKHVWLYFKSLSDNTIITLKIIISSTVFRKKNDIGIRYWFLTKLNIIIIFAQICVLVFKFSTIYNYGILILIISNNLNLFFHIDISIAVQ